MYRHQYLHCRHARNIFTQGHSQYIITNYTYHQRNDIYSQQTLELRFYNTANKIDLSTYRELPYSPKAQEHLLYQLFTPNT